MAYDYNRLAESLPELQTYLRDSATLDYSNPEAVRVLNRAILRADYNLKVDHVPPQHMFPSVPNRAAYLTKLAERLDSVFSHGSSETVLVVDIGTGVSAIYPLLGSRMFPSWQFIGVDVNETVLSAAQKNIDDNPDASQRIALVQNSDPTAVFTQNVLEQIQLRKEETLVATMCNPPFYASAADAQERKALKRHRPNIHNNPIAENEAIFSAGSGSGSGGDLGFVKKMVEESCTRTFHEQIHLFSSMIGLRESAKELERFLRDKQKAFKDLRFALDSFKVGHTVRWIVFWSFQYSAADEKELQLVSIDKKVDAKTLLTRYGQISGAENGAMLLVLNENRWSRAARRAAQAIPLEAPVSVHVSANAGKLALRLKEPSAEHKAAWNAFISFANHLRRLNQKE